jgi:hypothetical protein
MTLRTLCFVILLNFIAFIVVHYGFFAISFAILTISASILLFAEWRRRKYESRIINKG